MPDREKRPRRTSSRPACPFSRPNRHADRRECRAFGLQRPQLPTETDSPLERGRFELLVPAADAVGLTGRRIGHGCRRDGGRCRPDGDDPLAHRIGNPLLIGPTRQVGHRAHQTRAAGDIGSNDRGDWRSPCCLGAQRAPCFKARPMCAPIRTAVHPHPHRQNRRRRADRLETLMRVFAVRRLVYRAGL